MRAMKYIMAALTMMILSSCVYEYPVYIPAGTKLKLAFKLDGSVTDMYPEMTDVSDKEYDIRYVIKAYRMTNEGAYHNTPHAQFTYTKDDITSLDSTVLVELDEGQYKFYALADYVPQYEVMDNFYNTRSFADLYQYTNPYRGNTDAKTLYVGSKEVDIRVFTGEETSTDTISLAPALSKYQIVATDLQEFYKKMTGREEIDDELVGIHMKDYKVKVRYSDTDPLYTHMNLTTGNTPTRGETGLWFESKVTKLNETEAMLCFDHMMLGDTQHEVTVRVGIYDKTGRHITTSPIKFPPQKGKLTCVKGNFLTYVGLENPEQGGVIIDPGFNGNFDYDSK